MNYATTYNTARVLQQNEAKQILDSGKFNLQLQLPKDSKSTIDSIQACN